MRKSEISDSDGGSRTNVEKEIIDVLAIGPGPTQAGPMYVLISLVLGSWRRLQQSNELQKREIADDDVDDDDDGDDDDGDDDNDGDGDGGGDGDGDG